MKRPLTRLLFCARVVATKEDEMAKTKVPAKLVHPYERGRSREEQEKMGSLFRSLFVLFYPYVEVAVRPIVAEELSSQPPPTEEFVQGVKNLVSHIATEEGVPADKQQEILSKLDEVAKTPPSSDDIEAEVKEVVKRTTRILVSAWLEMLHFSCSNGKPPLEPATLDDAMLPPGVEFWVNLAWPDKMDTEFAKAILRQVRRDLPEGKCLPDEALELLQLLYK